jgi:glucose-6-phosphate isomerase
VPLPWISIFKPRLLDQNLPVLMALIGFWHRVICTYPTRAVIPYARALRLFPAFLQQLDMESNGKGVSLTGGDPLKTTGPIIWGGAGTDAQHSFFQLLHQGTDIIPVEFLLFKTPLSGKDEQGRQAMLLANGLAQSRALMLGRSADELQGDKALKAHKVSHGNRPSVMLLMDQLTPYTLGWLIALYEHRVFVEGVLYGVNSFDQWGVELGKVIAKELLPLLENATESSDSILDSSTSGLINCLHDLQPK